MSTEWIDNQLIRLLGDKNGHLITRFSYKFKHDEYPRISEYLRNRHEEFVTYSETYTRLRLHIEEHPRCLNCGKPTKYIGWKMFDKTGEIYRKFCSTRCSNIYNIDNVKETCKKRYGTISVSQTKWFRDKVEKTCMKKYGVKCNLSNKEIKEKIKETCVIKYGVEHISQAQSAISKSRDTLLRRYGVTCGYNKPDVMLKMKSKESQQKRAESLKRNGSYRKSMPEETLYKLLCEKYGSQDIVRQYSSSLYPFNCDFYIKSIDTYIELQGMWTHGGHPYDETSHEDQEKLNRWKSKHTKFYNNAIETWTIRDVAKRSKAKENNLRYIEIFNLDFEIIDKLPILDMYEDSRTEI